MRIKTYPLRDLLGSLPSQATHKAPDFIPGSLTISGAPQLSCDVPFDCAENRVPLFEDAPRFPCGSMTLNWIRHRPQVSSDGSDGSSKGLGGHVSRIGGAFSQRKSALDVTRSRMQGCFCVAGGLHPLSEASCRLHRHPQPKTGRTQRLHRWPALTTRYL